MSAVAVFILRALAKRVKAVMEGSCDCEAECEWRDESGLDSLTSYLYYIPELTEPWCFHSFVTGLTIP